MTTNQEGLHATVRALTSTTRSYTEDWHALFDADGITAGPFNARMLAWINATLGTSYTNLNGAMQAFAVEQGFANWASMNTFVTSLASFLLSRYGPYGMVMDFTDASISINDETDVLDYSSQGTVSATTGALLGPGSKLTYTAPSLKFTEQADGFIAGQAHNLILQSENMQATWSSPESTVTATSASTIRETSATNIHRWVQSSLTTLSGGTYQLSIEIQADGRSLIGIYTSGTNKHLGVDLSAGTIGSISSGFGTFDSSGTITPVGDNWYRLTLDGAGITAINIYMFTAWTAGGAATSNYAGNTGLGLKIRKVHLRRTPSVSTYVATTSAAVYDLPYVYSSGVKTGIMVEPAATNLCTYGATVGDANWNLVASASVTPAAAAGPTGEVNLALVTAASTSSLIRRIHSGALSVSTSYTTSCFAKAGTSARTRLALHDGVSEPGYVDMNWTAGVPSTHALSGTATAATYVELPGGLWRITATITTSASATSGRFHFYPDVLAGTGNCYIGLAQQELGTVATSPIITYGAAVTRAADNSLKVAVANFPVGGTAHTLYMELQRPEKDVTATFMTLQGTSTDFIQLIDDSASLRGVVRTVADGVTATLALATENALNTPFKIAISADTTADGVHNGGSVVPDAACICATTFATLDIGHASLTRPMLVKAIAYLPARKSGAELQGMTTP